MTKLVFGFDADVAAWTAERIPHMYGGDFGPCVAIGVTDEAAAIVGGVVYHNFMPDPIRSIEMSAVGVSPRWLSKRVLSGLFTYPFVQLKCRRVTMVTPERNGAARRFIRRFGFKQEGVVRKGFGSQHAIIYGMLASEWARSRFNLMAATAEKSPVELGLVT